MTLSKAKKKARKELLELANCYEPVKRKVLRNVVFRIIEGDLSSKYIGKAHDYSFWVKLT
jgi:hypothetical protein